MNPAGGVYDKQDMNNKDGLEAFAEVSIEQPQSVNGREPKRRYPTKTNFYLHWAAWVG